MIARKNQEERKIKETGLAVYRAWTWKEKKWISTSELEGKPGRRKINESYDVFNYFLSSYSLSNPDSGKHMKPFKAELGNKT